MKSSTFFFSRGLYISFRSFQCGNIWIVANEETGSNKVILFTIILK